MEQKTKVEIAIENEAVIKNFLTSYESQMETKLKLSNFLFDLSRQWIEIHTK